jgi:hypothetical protein
LLAVILLALTTYSAHAQDESQAPKQPIPFNHKLHVTDLKVPCKICHPNPDPGEMMGLPEVSTCMQCHSTIEPKTAAERKLAAFAKQNRDLDWARVYQIPTFVRFDHRQHLQAGAKCETCHGPVAQRNTLRQEHEVTMGACMNCHRATHAALDCGSCHEPR